MGTPHPGVGLDPTVVSPGAIWIIEAELGIHVERQHCQLLILAAIGGDFAAFAKQNEVVHAIPMLDDIQTPSYKLRPFTSFSSAFRNSIILIA
jgi:hypothetical protein